MQLRNQELLVATEVRDVTRQVVTNQKRMDTTRAARQLMERRLEAEQRKFDAGTSTSFFVFQAQRDLARPGPTNCERSSTTTRSIVDYETIQDAPLR